MTVERKRAFGQVTIAVTIKDMPWKETRVEEQRGGLVQAHAQGIGVAELALGTVQAAHQTGAGSERRGLVGGEHHRRDSQGKGIGGESSARDHSRPLPPVCGAGRA